MTGAEHTPTPTPAPPQQPIVFNYLTQIYYRIKTNWKMKIYGVAVFQYIIVIFIILIKCL